MSIGTWLRNGVRGLAANSSQGMDSTYRVTQSNLANTSTLQGDPRERYALLRSYYEQNGLYDRLTRALYESGLWNRAVKPLRNPAYRIVEAYPAHLWPGDLPDALKIKAENKRLLDPIHQLWQWSNWASKKQIMARWLPLLGDVFLKVVRDPIRPRVWFELVDPAHVADFECDERGNLTWVRIEVLQCRRVGQTTQPYTHVEIWSKAEQTFSRWEVLGVRPKSWIETDLGPPVEVVPFSEIGLDFVPIVHAKFLDIGEKRGIGAFLLQLDKIDSVNADATRLSQMLYRHNQATWALHGAGNDASGRPLPAPRLSNGTEQADDTALWRDNQLIRLPGTSELTPLVPNLQYEAHRLVNNDGILDLQNDCPEMAYWRITEMGANDLSGRALRFMLAPFIKRVLEARGNAEDALARADAMALSLAGAAPALPGFTDIGTFDQGDFEHGFQPRDVIPISDMEEAQADQMRADAAKKKLESGAWSVAQVLRDAGYSEEQIKTIMAERVSVDVIPTVEQ
jgi:hypothetical protein